ncbi:MULTISPECIES: GNAT family N-acetyltransferase [Arenibacter]|uniref:GNAT family N-acetyltransferase n=1 Tax=Arenibacter TaxID=178469 RepID=UPI001C068971|nr:MULTISPECIES: GNAT family N-acetyltransferase [Arenibacter]MBU2906086.1 GNAT family N-acetyltransferase [Arenibacter algicola]MCK0137320.1 GNAT family N-acetyltransferase [Arenibacter sp. S6351L]
MQEFTVRTATLDDLKILLSFEQEIIRAERPFDETLDKDPISYYDLRQLLLSDEAEVMVAELDSRIVGSGYALIRDAKPYLDHKKYTYLGFMYTDGDQRGKGVNKAIVDALVHWSKSKGIHEIRLTVYNENAPAIRAYEKVGFKKHILEMRVHVD